MGYGLGDDSPGTVGAVVPAQGVSEACEATRAILDRTAVVPFPGLDVGGGHLDPGGVEKRQEGPVQERIREAVAKDAPASDLEVAQVAIGACVGDLLLGRSNHTRRVIGMADALGALKAVAGGLERVTPWPPVEPAARLPWIQARIAEIVSEYLDAYPGDDGSALRYALEGAADRDRRTREQARKAARVAARAEVVGK